MYFLPVYRSQQNNIRVIQKKEISTFDASMQFYSILLEKQTESERDGK